MTSLKLEDNNHCYVCGKNNIHGFKLNFIHPSPGHLVTEVVFGPEHQGFKNITHGGFVAMLLDEVMINLAWKEGLRAVTGELVVRLKKSVPTGQKVRFEGFLKSRQGRLVILEAKALDLNLNILATASAKCLSIPTS